MDYSDRLALSYYKTVATINEGHQVFLVQHQCTNKIYIKKTLDVYSKQVFDLLKEQPVTGTPQIIELHEVEGKLVLIEEYISGTSLAELIDNHTLSPNEIYRLSLELCDIIESLHQFKPAIIHRDIKPSNIIISNTGAVVLLDFNAAKLYDSSSDSDTVLLGTKGYAAPEQYGFGSSSEQTDIYAIGILIKEMFSSVNSAPKLVSRIIDKCTRMSPAERYRTVTDLKRDLQRLSESPHIHISKKVSPVLPPGFRSGSPWKMLLAIMGYGTISWLCFGLDVANSTLFTLWVSRIFCFAIFISVIFITCNYRNIQRFMPLCSSSNLIIRIIGVLLMDILSVFALFLIMALLCSI